MDDKNFFSGHPKNLNYGFECFQKPFLHPSDKQKPCDKQGFFVYIRIGMCQAAFPISFKCRR